MEIRSEPCLGNQGILKTRKKYNSTLLMLKLETNLWELLQSKAQKRIKIGKKQWISWDFRTNFPMQDHNLKPAELIPKQAPTASLFHNLTKARD
jgi:hypothetical protein